MPIAPGNKTQARFLKQLGNNAEAFLLLLDTLPDTAVYVKDRKGHIMWINPWNSANCNAGNTVSEVIGKTSRDLFPEPCAKSYVDTDNRVMRTGKPIIDGILAAPDLTTKFMICNKVPLRGKDGKVIGVAAVYRYIKGMDDLPGWHGGFSAVAAYITDHYAEPITIKQLAGIARCSPSMFVRGFKRLFKMTSINYLLLTRVNAARDLLEHSNRLVSDIAQTVGFYDQSHFIRVFKRFRTLTPHQYRRRYQKRVK